MTNKLKAILIFGAPGAGKGTMGAMITAAANLYHLSTGDIFRGMAKDSENGKLIASYADKGMLVPDEATMKIWCRYTQGLIDTNVYNPAKQLLLLDGLPRTVEQAKLIEEYVEVQKGIMLEIKDAQVVIDRILGRGKSSGRADDADVAIIRKRLNEYKEKTAPVIDHYPENLITRINAENTPVEVLRDVLIGAADVLKKSPSEA